LNENEVSKNASSVEQAGGTDKLTKWYFVLIISIIYFPLEPLIEYAFGRLGMVVLADLSRYACFPVIILFCISACVMSSWSNRRPNWRRARAIFYFPIYAGVLVIIFLFGSFQIFIPPSLIGFRDRIVQKADFHSIWQWGSSVNLEHDNHNNDFYWWIGKDADKPIPILKNLKPEVILVSEYTDDEDGTNPYRVVHVRWTGWWASWRLSICPPEIGMGRIPQCNHLLQIEPGVFVYKLYK
jgi:hypothetical protein